MRAADFSYLTGIQWALIAAVLVVAVSQFLMWKRQREAAKAPLPDLLEHRRRSDSYLSPDEAAGALATLYIRGFLAMVVGLMIFEIPINNKEMERSRRVRFAPCRVGRAL